MTQGDLDARVRLVLLVVWTLALFGVDGFGPLLALCLAGAALCAVQGIRPRAVVASLSVVAVMLATLVVAGSLRFDGTGDVTVASQVGISTAGLCASGLSALRIVAMIVLCLAAVGNTGYLRMLDAMADLLAPLKALKLPVDDLVAIATVGLSSLPALRAEFSRVADAQRARGARLGKGGLWRSISSWLPVLVPVLVGMFRRASDLSRAMAARRWRKSGRTRLDHRALAPLDWIVLVAGCALCAAVVIVF